ncbi:MerR family transcriptional regulator [Serinibacter arcticus]|uniref:MerR family transcriptional regulator n=1 Tax=Serinibacter arcticus TaxID=1655435 RepID=A0A2U1ZUL8_9MICO|nr:MerR family transcriptional regulator [Serinibacter arcticus]PWD50676.1 MerR family transcriptional regulator [Serinibacter arcticus]
MTPTPTPTSGEGEGEAVTVGVVARALGVSIRTLHHWDALGAVTPSTRSSGGYRAYLPADVACARRVLLLRDLGVPLAEIPGLLAATAAERRAELVRRRGELSERIARLQQVAADVEAVLAADERGVLLPAAEAAEVFGPGWDPGWSAAARERWGDTAQWAEYAERSAGRSAQDWSDVVHETREVLREMAQACGTGVGPGQKEAIALAERHRAAMGAHFHVTPSMHVVMGRLYASEPGFTAELEDLQEGLTSWLRDAIDAAARARGVDPEAARWE